MTGRGEPMEPKVESAREGADAAVARQHSDDRADLSSLGQGQLSRADGPD
jgi:hypothetical protein